MRRAARIAAVLGGLVFLGPGLWAFFSPATFFEVAAPFDPYNAHLLRDIGAFQIGLGSVLFAGLVMRDALPATLTGAGIGAAFHTVAHVIDRDLGGDPTTDIPFFAVVTVVLLAGAVAATRATGSDNDVS